MLYLVAPLVGAWIEIALSGGLREGYRTSLLSWERGLKSRLIVVIHWRSVVAPLVGAWIEMVIYSDSIRSVVSRSSRGSVDWNLYIIHLIHLFSVAPLVGAWIEMPELGEVCNYDLSLLSWERGLKLNHIRKINNPGNVAPLVGAWIEIWCMLRKKDCVYRRSSRGSVDWNNY